MTAAQRRAERALATAQRHGKPMARVPVEMLATLLGELVELQGQRDAVEATARDLVRRIGRTAAGARHAAEAREVRAA